MPMNAIAKWCSAGVFKQRGRVVFRYCLLRQHRPGEPIVVARSRVRTSVLEAMPDDVVGASGEQVATCSQPRSGFTPERYL